MGRGVRHTANEDRPMLLLDHLIRGRLKSTQRRIEEHYIS